MATIRHDIHFVGDEQIRATARTFDIQGPHETSPTRMVEITLGRPYPEGEVGIVMTERNARALRMVLGDVLSPTLV